ncbi:MAG: CRISPR-associated endonuclease Cas6 [Pseudomonadota bacterium]
MSNHLSDVTRQYERDRLLVAQLLTAMRGLNVNFGMQLYAAFTHIETIQCRYKNQTMLGIKGDFVSNALLPSGLAIGHAVSHGYGWMILSCTPVSCQLVDLLAV